LVLTCGQETDVEVEGELFPSLILESVINGDVEGYIRAIEAGENIDEFNENGWTAAMIAVGRSDLEMLIAIVDAGADLNLANGDGITALMLAASEVSIAT
jgi:hypothetical protein